MLITKLTASKSDGKPMVITLKKIAFLISLDKNRLTEMLRQRNLVLVLKIYFCIKSFCLSVAMRYQTIEYGILNSPSVS